MVGAGVTTGTAGEGAVTVDLTVVVAVPEDDWVRTSGAVVRRLLDRLGELARGRAVVLPADPPTVRTRVQGGRVVAVVRADGRPTAPRPRP